MMSHSEGMTPSIVGEEAQEPSNELSESANSANNGPSSTAALQTSNNNKKLFVNNGVNSNIFSSKNEKNDDRTEVRDPNISSMSETGIIDNNSDNNLTKSNSSALIEKVNGEDGNSLSDSEGQGSRVLESDELDIVSEVIPINREELLSLSTDALWIKWQQQERLTQKLITKIRQNTQGDDVDYREENVRLKNQLAEAQRKEAYHVMRLTTKEHEVQEMVATVAATKSYTVPRTSLLDPTVNICMERLKRDLEAARTKMEEAQNELAAWKFTPDSNTGKQLMAKCRLLIKENEELGRVISSGKLAKLEGDIALQRNFTEELKKSQSELDEFLLEMDEDTEGMQGTIMFLQQQLRIAKQQQQLTGTSTPPVPHANTPPLLHANTPPLPHANTPPLQHANTPPLLNASTPPFRHANTPPLPHISTPPLPDTSTPPLSNISPITIAKTSIPTPTSSLDTPPSVKTEIFPASPSVAATHSSQNIKEMSSCKDVCGDDELLIAGDKEICVSEKTGNGDPPGVEEEVTCNKTGNGDPPGVEEEVTCNKTGNDLTTQLNFDGKVQSFSPSNTQESMLASVESMVIPNDQVNTSVDDTSVIINGKKRNISAVNWETDEAGVVEPECKRTRISELGEDALDNGLPD